MPLLEAKNVSKSFPILSPVLRRIVGEVNALIDVSFTLKEGEVLGIVGESGSGKSTLARVILKLLLPSRGNVFFEGKDISNLTKKELFHYRKSVQAVFQHPMESLNPRKCIYETLEEPLRHFGLYKTENEKNEKIDALLAKVHLPNSALYRYPHEFSGGQQQRISLARALAVEPKVLVADEALSALDVSVQAQILALLQELKEKEKLSFLFISHDLRSVDYFAGRALVMHHGRAIEEGETETLFRFPKDPYTKLLVSSIFD